MPAKTLSWSKEPNEVLHKAREHLNKTLAYLQSEYAASIEPKHINTMIESCKTHLGYINEELSLRGIQNEAE